MKSLIRKKAQIEKKKKSAQCCAKNSKIAAGCQTERTSGAQAAQYTESDSSRLARRIYCDSPRPAWHRPLFRLGMQIRLARAHPCASRHGQVRRRGPLLSAIFAVSLHHRGRRKRDCVSTGTGTGGEGKGKTHPL